MVHVNTDDNILIMAKPYFSMNYLSWYADQGIEPDSIFNFMIDTLRDSIKTWDYFVNWDKVNNNLNNIKIELNILNSLLGTKNFDYDFIALVTRYPEVVRAIPTLLAVRYNRVNVLTDRDGDNLMDVTYSFLEGDISPSQCLEFVNNSGLSRLFTSSNTANLIDYVYGVEVGLDSNGRKNRGGTNMERIVENLLLSIISGQDQYQMITQATADRISAQWGVSINVDKTQRAFDFAIYNIKAKRLFLIETNFFNGGGSKLKSVCGEFQSLHNLMKSQNVDLIWITDGVGWLKTKRPLEEAFNTMDYIFNLRMVGMGALEHVISCK